VKRLEDSKDSIAQNGIDDSSKDIVSFSSYVSCAINAIFQTCMPNAEALGISRFYLSNFFRSGV
jgi:hypothetical protein